MTPDELAMARAYANEGWAWVDDFCEALGEGTTVFNFKEQVTALRARVAQLEGALQRIIDTHYTEHISCADIARQALQEQSDAVS